MVEYFVPTVPFASYLLARWGQITGTPEHCRRLVRSMVEYFVPTVPFASYLLARWGQITGTPDNCRRLLAAEEAVLVFPEGARGIPKPFSKRYQLAEFGTGFMRLALEMRAPIVPIAVIAAEEQAPAITAKPIARLLGTI